MCFHPRMAQFEININPYVAESYTHGRPYYGKKENCEKNRCLVRLQYDMLGFDVFSSEDGTI